MSYLLVAAIFAVLAFAFSRKIIPTIGNFVFGLALSYVFMPTLAWGFLGTNFFFAAGLLGAMCAAMYRMSSFSQTDRAAEERAGKQALYLGMGSAVAIVFAIIVIPVFTTWSFFTADTRRTLLEVTEETTFDPSKMLFDQSQARYVDEFLATRRMNELCGEHTGLCSQTDFGRPRIQNQNGKMYWVAPLQHEGFTKWWTNKTVPGYAMVSVTDYSDAKLVLKHNQSIGLDGFQFGDYLPRFLYENGFANASFADYTYELDDTGTPHWVVSKIARKAGFGGEVVASVVIVNPVTRELKEYSVADAPKWVERIQPEKLIEDRISDWGAFPHGWWESFSGRDVLAVTPGSALVYTVDGRAVWYTGIQSSGGNAEATMGFMLTDSRTGKAVFYKRAGITENAAQRALEGMVQDQKWTASPPVPYMVFGVPTFISIMKDQAGNRAAIGMISYDNREVKAVGERNDLDSVLRAYKFALQSKGTKVDLKDQVDEITLEGIITLIVRETGKDGTVINFMIDSMPNKGFEVLSNVSSELRFTKEGHRVRVRVNSAAPAVIDVNNFDNLDIQLYEGTIPKTPQ